MIKVVFMGTPEFSTPVLRKLIDDPEIEIPIVITQPDRPVGRGAVMTSPPVKLVAQEASLTIMQPDNVNGDDVVEALDEVNPDFIVVVAYGQILSKEILGIPKQDTLNIHASLLPKYRGASPIQTAILAGDEKTGVSIMKVERKMDTGPVYLAAETDLAGKTYADLSSELAELGAKTLIKVVKGFDSYEPKDQSDDDSTYCRKIKKKDGEIVFEDMDASEIMCRYRAFYGWPGVFTYIVGKRVVLVEIEESDIVCDDEVGKPCSVENGAFIAAKEGVIELKRVKPEGKQEMSGVDFLRGLKKIVAKEM